MILLLFQTVSTYYIFVLWSNKEFKNIVPLLIYSVFTYVRYLDSINSSVHTSSVADIVFSETVFQSMHRLRRELDVT